MPETPKLIDPRQLRRTDLAEALKVTPKTVNNWKDDGCPHTGQAHNIRYDLADVCEWLKNRAVATATKHLAPSTGDFPSKEESEAELVYWKVQTAKHEALLQSKDMVSMDDARKELALITEHLRQTILAIEFSWAPFIVGIGTLDAAQQLLRDRVDVLMQTLTNLPEDVETADDFTAEPDEDGDDS